MKPDERSADHSPQSNESPTAPPSLYLKWGIRVTAASRLSFTMIDMNGETGRRNGVASLALREPSFEAIIEPASNFALVTDAYSDSHRPAIESFLAKLANHLDEKPVKVTVRHGLPPNSGFGSKTTTLMALGKAYAALYERNVTSDEIARLAGRGGTSGASVNLIDCGGFLVDGGHKNPPDFQEDPQKHLVPSRFAQATKRPPVLINLKFPPWPILIIMPAGVNTEGQTELNWFRQTVPIPADEARRTAHTVFMNLAPAIAEQDYDLFCRAVNRITFASYFKRKQIQSQGSQVQALVSDAAKQSYIDAFGMSSMGPMCFAFTRQPELATTWLQEKMLAGTVGSFWFTSAQNGPIVIEGIPLQSKSTAPVAAPSGY